MMVEEIEMTPWGASKKQRRIAEGIVCHTTQTHGGIILDKERDGAIPHYARKPGRAYEGSYDWAIVATWHPAAFNGYMARNAKRALRDWNPDIYERHYGVVLGAGESFIKDARRCRNEN